MTIHSTQNRLKPHAVYVARDAQGRAVYAGCTRDLKKRMAQHRARGSAWLTLAGRLDVAEYPNFWAARFAEKQTIRSLRPRFNVVTMRSSGGHYRLILEQYAAPATSKFTVLLSPGNGAAS